MTERVNLCDFFVYGNVVKCRSDSSLAHFLWLFLCSPMIVNLSPLLACGKFHLLCKDLWEQFFAVPLRSHRCQFRVGLSYLQTFRKFCGEWCSRCGSLLSFETFAGIRHIVYISAVSNDLLLFLSIVLSPEMKTRSICAKFCSDPCFQDFNRIGRTSLRRDPVFGNKHC